MRCMNCGKEYGDEMNFCPYCGTPKHLADVLDETKKIMDDTENVPPGNVKKEENRSQNNSSENNEKGETKLGNIRKTQIMITKKKWPIIILVPAILICGILTLINITDHSAEQFVKDVQAGNITDATEIYQRKLLNHEKRDTKAKQLVEMKLSDIVESYNRGELSVDDAIEKVNAFAQFYYDEAFPFQKEVVSSNL